MLLNVKIKFGRSFLLAISQKKLNNKNEFLNVRFASWARLICGIFVPNERPEDTRNI